MWYNSSSTNDSRVFERFPTRFPAKIKDARDDYGQKFFLRNASAEGACLISKEKLYLNDSLTLEVRLPDKDIPMTLKGRVVWTKESAPDVWSVGLQFHAVSLVHMSRLYELHEPLYKS